MAGRRQRQQTKPRLLRSELPDVHQHPFPVGFNASGDVTDARIAA
jgi:hypothetical protein